MSSQMSIEHQNWVATGLSDQDSQIRRRIFEPSQRRSKRGIARSKIIRFRLFDATARLRSFNAISVFEFSKSPMSNREIEISKYE